MHWIKSLALLPLALAAGACSGGRLQDSRHPTGSQAITTSSNFSAIYTANAGEGTVTRVDTETNETVEVDVGDEPTRIARTPDRIFVTLRAERGVAVLEEQAGQLAVVDRIEVGTEPVGVVATEDGTKIYVAESTSDRVSEIDAETLSVLRSWSVTDEPRWLALHPSGDSLYVASMRKGTLTRIILDAEDETEVVALPTVKSFDAFGSEVALSRRLTGDPAFTAEGDTLIIPALYVDNVSEIAEAGDVGQPVFTPGGGGYDSTTSGTKRFNPVVVFAPVNDSGVAAHIDDMSVVTVNAFTDTPVTSYPSSVTPSPDGEIVVVTVEGSSAVVAMPIDGASEGRSVFDVFSEQNQDPAFNVLSFRNQVAISTDMGPTGAVFTADNQAHVYNFLDRTVGSMGLETVRSDIGLNDDDGDADHAEAGGGRLAKTNNAEADFARAEPGFFGGGFGHSMSNRVVVSASTLSSAQERGRRLFFSANDARMATVGAGISCATCHFKGRNDGITWTFTRGLRQTPSLAGKVSQTNPVRWEGDRASVAEDAFMTSQGLMGGQGLTDLDTRDIEAFVDNTRDVDVPLKGSSDERVLRGRDIFNRPDVACGSCHSGVRLTDNRTYRMFGMNVQTRSLSGIAASPPYFHDGSVETLRDVVEASRSNGMGDTSMLDATETEDLLIYLGTL